MKKYLFKRKAMVI